MRRWRGLRRAESFLPADIGVSFTAGAGYSWFGNQSPELGGFPLPAYWNWQGGVTFSYKVFNLDLRYYDTNLSKEDCFVLTGDPMRGRRRSQSHHESRRINLGLVQGHLCCESLICFELAAHTVAALHEYASDPKRT
jgi:hypothetical protein